jgi:hypothetical protein
MLIKELLGIFEISVGNFMRNPVPRRISGANPTWLKTKLVEFTSLAKCRDFMYRLKYVSVIGYEGPVFHELYLSFQVMSFYSQSHRRF